MVPEGSYRARYGDLRWYKSERIPIYMELSLLTGESGWHTIGLLYFQRYYPYRAKQILRPLGIRDYADYILGEWKQNMRIVSLRVYVFHKQSRRGKFYYVVVPEKVFVPRF